MAGVADVSGMKPAHEYRRSTVDEAKDDEEWQRREEAVFLKKNEDEESKDRKGGHCGGFHDTPTAAREEWNREQKDVDDDDV